MEFERAIYRVYERCLEGLREDQDVRGNASMKSCKFLELLSLCFGTLMLMALVFLHSQFVGTPGCLPDLLTGALVPMNQTYDSDYPYLKYDQVLYITIVEINKDEYLGENKPVQDGKWRDLVSLYTLLETITRAMARRVFEIAPWQ